MIVGSTTILHRGTLQNETRHWPYHTLSFHITWHSKTVCGHWLLQS